MENFIPDAVLRPSQSKEKYLYFLKMSLSESVTFNASFSEADGVRSSYLDNLSRFYDISDFSREKRPSPSPAPVRGWGVG